MNGLSKVFTFLLLSTTFSTSLAANVTVSCVFSHELDVFITGATELYVCDVQNDFTSPVSTVVGIEGTHLTDQTNANVEVLQFVSRELDLLPSNFHEFFPSLVGIKIQDTPLSFISSSDLRVFNDLKYLTITGALLSAIVAGTFDSNVALEFVDLSNNMISFIDKGAFDKLAVLKELNLTDILCLQDELAQNSVNDQATLIALKTLVGEKCTGTGDLQSLISKYIRDYVEAARASESCSMVDNCEEFCHESQVELELNLGRAEESLATCEDELRAINVSLIAAESEVETIKAELDDCNNPVNGTCRFREVSDIYGYGCVASGLKVNETGIVEWSGEHATDGSNELVTSLVIRGQNVVVVPRGVAVAFRNLRIFVIENSKLTKIQRSDFVELIALLRLEITGNAITSIESGSFDLLVALEYLDLARNAIKVLPAKACSKLVKLRYLNLSENQLTVIKYDIIESVNQIQFFYASSNTLMNYDVNLIWRLQRAELIDLTGTGCEMKFDKATDPITSFINFFSAVIGTCGNSGD